MGFRGVWEVLTGGLELVTFRLVSFGSFIGGNQAFIFYSLARL